MHTVYRWKSQRLVKVKDYTSWVWALKYTFTHRNALLRSELGVWYRWSDRGLVATAIQNLDMFIQEKI